MKKVSIILINLLVVAVLLLAVDFVLGKLVKKSENYSAVRYVQMREIGMPNKKYTFHDIAEYYLKTSDNLANVKKEFHMETDSHGFIKSRTQHTDPEFNVVFLGGSTTECVYIDDTLRYPGQVADRFAKAGRKVNTYNSGVSRNTTMNSLNILVNKVIRSNFQVAVLMHAINDYTLLGYYGSYYFDEDGNQRANLVSVNSPNEFLRKELENGGIPHRMKIALQSLYPHLYVRMHDALHHALNPDAPLRLDFENMKLRPLGQAQFDQFKYNLTTFVAICRANKITPVLMTQPNRIIPENFYQIPAFKYHRDKFEASGISIEAYCDGYVRMNQIIREVSAEENVKLIDLDRTVPKSKELMYDIAHLTGEGATLVADVIYASLDSVLYGQNSLVKQ
jgi:hypothetical protein